MISEYSLTEKRLQQQTFEALVQALNQQTQTQREQLEVMREFASMMAEIRDALNDLADAQYIKDQGTSDTDPKDYDDEED